MVTVARICIWFQALLRVSLTPPTPRAHQLRRLLSTLALLAASLFFALLLRYPAVVGGTSSVLWVGAHVVRTLLFVGVSVALGWPLRWQPPTPQMARVGQLITTLASIAIAATVTFAWVTVALAPSVLTIVVDGTILLHLAVVWWLARHGQVHLAAPVFLLGCGLVVVAEVSHVGPLHHLTTVLGYTLLILLGGLLIRWWVGLVLAVVLPLLHTALQAAALIPPPSDGAWAVGAVILFSSIGGVVALYTRSLEHALLLADQRAAQLATAHAEVAQVVAQQDQRITQATAQLTYQAYHDPLTTLPNRARFWDALTTALDPGAHAPRPVAVLFLDLDGFKGVNDRLGHAAGDALLVIVAERLRACMRPDDVVARVGGDEFAALLHDVAVRATVVEVARRMVGAVEAPIVIRGQSVTISTSIGVVLSGEARWSPDEIVRVADEAMYQAKQAGKGCYQVVDHRPTPA